MKKAEIEEICSSLIDELRAVEGNSIYEDDSLILEYILSKVFKRADAYPETSIYIRREEIFDRHLGHLSTQELRDIYLFSRPFSKRNNAIKNIIDKKCKNFMPEPSNSLIVEVPFDCTFLDDIFSSCNFRYSPPIWFNYPRFRHNDFDSDDSEKSDLIVGNISLNISRHLHGELYRAIQNNSLYLGVSSEILPLTVHRIEKSLINSEVYIFEHEKDMLEVIRPSTCPNSMVMMVDVVNDKSLEIPYDEIDSLRPTRYFEDRKFFGANQHIENFKRAFDNTLKLLDNEKYTTAWNSDDLFKRINLYLNGLKNAGVLDKRYQTKKQSEMQAVACAISYRLRLFKYKNGSLQAPADTGDFKGFVSCDKKWKPGRFLNRETSGIQQQVMYIWRPWSDIFNWTNTKNDNLRQRAYDNKFSKPMKRKIARIMLSVEEQNRELFPEYDFPIIRVED